MSKLRGAVIGVGYLGTFHAQKYKNNPDVELVGVCDFYTQQADKVAQELGVTSFHKPEQLLGKVDLVTIAASTQSHYELAKLFIQQGVHVNVEKPITATLPQAEELLALAEKHKVQVAVGHIERFNPAILELKKHLKDVQFIELKRFAPFKARGADVSVLHDLMIHDLDLLTWLTGSEVAEISASGLKLITSQFDTVSAHFKMKNGIQALIQVSRVSAVGERSIRVQQKGATLFANTGTLEIEKITPGSDINTDALKVEKWTVEKADALQSETNAFIAAIKNKAPTVVNGRDGFLALQNVVRVEEALLKKGT